MGRAALASAKPGLPARDLSELRRRGCWPRIGLRRASTRQGNAALPSGIGADYYREMV